MNVDKLRNVKQKRRKEEYLKDRNGA